MNNVKTVIVGLMWVALCVVAGSAKADPVYYSEADCGCSVNMQYNGGPVMTGVTDVYAIWYGDWSGSSAVPAVDTFFSNLTGSDFMNLASLYGASTSINFEGNIFQSYPVYGTQIYDSQIASLIKNLASGPTPDYALETNAIYFVFTAPNVTDRDYYGDCGYHSDTSGKYKYAAIFGNFASLCSGTTVADGLISSSSHELMEALTDPLIAEDYNYSTGEWPPGPPLGWNDGDGGDGEVSDICEDQTAYTSIGGVREQVNPVWAPDPNYVSPIGTRPGGFCSVGDPLATAAPVPEPPAWLILLFCLPLLQLFRARKPRRIVRLAA